MGLMIGGGSFDTYCAFCGMAFFAVELPRFPDEYENLKPGEDFDINKKMKIISKWLDKVTLILQGDTKAKHGFKCEESIMFINLITGDDIDVGMTDAEKGVAMHTDCWKFAKKIFKALTLHFPIFNLF